jgi:hypothetical protein
MLALRESAVRNAIIEECKKGVLRTEWLGHVPCGDAECGAK